MLSWTQKQPSIHDFLTKMITRVGLVLIPNGETRKKKQEHDMCKIKVEHDFIAKTKQE